jgi:glycosyltransferase involved in cell wall biosynthesis
MRILHVINSIDPAAGGPPLVAIRLASAQAALGHDVTVLSIRYRDAEKRIEAANRLVPGVDKVKIRYVEHLRAISRRIGYVPQKQLSQHVLASDWVHIHGVWEVLLAETAMLARAAKIPYCVRPAGMLDPWSLSQKSPKKKLAMRLWVSSMLNKAAFIHTLNRDEAQLLSPLGLSAEIRVIPNGVFLEEMEPASSSDPALKNETAKTVLFLARKHHKKGLDYLLDAFEVVAERTVLQSFSSYGRPLFSAFLAVKKGSQWEFSRLWHMVCQW